MERPFYSLILYYFPAIYLDTLDLYTKILLKWVK